MGKDIGIYLAISFVLGYTAGANKDFFFDKARDAYDAGRSKLGEPVGKVYDWTQIEEKTKSLDEGLFEATKQDSIDVKTIEDTVEE